MTLPDSISSIEGTFPLLAKTEFRGEWTLSVDRLRLQDVCAFAKQELGFDMLMDVSGVDNFGDEPRFEVVYQLYSSVNNTYLRLKVSVSEDALEVPTVSTVWSGGDWQEREVYDMMGITFPGHRDLRRILMWDGYPFFPLRKDFPLAGRPSDVPEVAFTKAAPLEGGPFITTASTATAKDREPRARRVE